MGLLGPGGVPIQPPTAPPPHPPVDIVRGTALTVMVYPQLDNPEALAVIAHWSPNVDPRLVLVAFQRAANMAEKAVAAAFPPNGTVEPPTDAGG